MGKMAILFGGAVGAGAVYFVNSKRGSKTSSFSPSQASSFAQQTAQQVQSKASSMASTAAGAVKNQASSVVGTVKGQASSAAGTVKDQTSSAVEGAEDQTSNTPGSTGAGAGAATQQSGANQPDNPTPDDNTLRDRVETELFRRAWVPKGNINIDVVDGIVELRGQLKHQTDVDTLIKDARAVQHVKDVRSFLHLPGTPAPNKESAIEAS